MKQGWEVSGGVNGESKVAHTLSSGTDEHLAGPTHGSWQSRRGAPRCLGQGHLTARGQKPRTRQPRGNDGHQSVFTSQN